MAPEWASTLDLFRKLQPVLPPIAITLMLSIGVEHSGIASDLFQQVEVGVTVWTLQFSEVGVQAMFPLAAHPGDNESNHVGTAAVVDEHVPVIAQAPDELLQDIVLRTSEGQQAHHLLAIGVFNDAADGEANDLSETRILRGELLVVDLWVGHPRFVDLPFDVVLDNRFIGFER